MGTTRQVSFLTFRHVWVSSSLGTPEHRWLSRQTSVWAGLQCWEVTGRQTDLALLEHFWLGRLWHSLLWWSTGTSTHLLAGAALHLFSTEGRHTWGTRGYQPLTVSLSFTCWGTS